MCKLKLGIWVDRYDHGPIPEGENICFLFQRVNFLNSLQFGNVLVLLATT